VAVATEYVPVLTPVKALPLPVVNTDAEDTAFPVPITPVPAVTSVAWPYTPLFMPVKAPPLPSVIVYNVVILFPAPTIPVPLAAFVPSP